MDTLAFVEGEKSALFKHLDATFAVGSLAEVASLAPTFCRVLCEQLRTRIIANAPRIFPGSQVHKGAYAAIDAGGRVFRVNYTTEPLTNRDVLPFVIAEHGGDGSLPPVASAPNVVQLSRIAQFREIQFSVDSALKFSEEILDALARGMFSAGYQWLSNKLTNAIKSDTAKISTMLYDYMRSMLAEHLELLDGFLFSCIMDGRDFVILDSLVAEGSLRLAEQRAPRFQRPKEAMVIQVMTEIVSVEESIIIDACASPAETTTMPLTPQSTYYRRDEEFFDSMAAVWGKEVVCHPIVRRGHLRVVAFYPAINSGELTQLLSLHLSTLEQLASGQTSLIRQHLELLSRAIAPRGEAVASTGKRWMGMAEAGARLAGVFGGAFIKSANE
jgi:hypothetical protein